MIAGSAGGIGAVVAVTFGGAMLSRAIEADMMCRAHRHNSMTREHIIDRLPRQRPVGRIGLPATGATAIVLLCKPANDIITGALSPVDGGQPFVRSEPA